MWSPRSRALKNVALVVVLTFTLQNRFFSPSSDIFQYTQDFRIQPKEWHKRGLKLASCFGQNTITALPELDDAYLLSKGITYVGTLHALKWSITRALERGQLRIGVAGGSVSVGAGCYNQPKKMWFNHVSTEVSRKLHSLGLNVTLTFVNIAQGATGPERVFFCGNELFNHEEVDILLLEYAINESGGTYSELVLRQMSKKSAVIFVETFTLRDKRQGFKSAQKEHDVLAKYYDVPIISARDAFRDAFRRDVNFSNAYFSLDQHHPSCCGHVAMGGLVAALLSDAIDASLLRPNEDASSVFSKGVVLPEFLNLSNVHLPRYILDRVPDCMLAVSRLRNFSQSSWHEGQKNKPTFDCTSPKDGNFSVKLNCNRAQFEIGNHFCQVIIFYT